MTQPERLRAALDSGQAVTRLSALTDLGIFELSARIIELQRSGYKVTKRSVTVVNRFGERVRVTEYRKEEIKGPRVWERSK